MQKELYFDISSEEKGGSLFRIKKDDNTFSFYYNHSTYDANKDEIKVFESHYDNFQSFWNELIKNKDWFYLHPLFVHPEQREFVRNELKTVNWNVHPNKKWQDSHQRQWKKVLSDPSSYYNPQ
jgi:hypothetical protein